MNAQEFMTLKSAQMMEVREEMSAQELETLINELFAQSKQMKAESMKLLKPGTNDDEAQQGVVLGKRSDKYSAIASNLHSYMMVREGRW